MRVGFRDLRRKRRGGAAFSPSDIAGLVLWLDASDASTITADASDRVSEWADLSGNNLDAAQVTASYMPLTAQSTKNGLNVLTFDGVNDHFATPAPAVGFGDVTVFAVAQATAATAGYRTIINRDEETGDRHFQFRLVDGGLQFVHVTPTVNVGTVTDQRGAYHIFAGRAEYDGVSDTDVAACVDGASIATGSVAGQDEAGLGVFRIGTFGSITYPWNGEMAEVIVYSAALSLTDRQSVETYLAAKWGITLA